MKDIQVIQFHFGVCGINHGRHQGYSCWRLQLLPIRFHLGGTTSIIINNSFFFLLIIILITYWTPVAAHVLKSLTVGSSSNERGIRSRRDGFNHILCGRRDLKTINKQTTNNKNNNYNNNKREKVPGTKIDWHH